MNELDEFRSTTVRIAGREIGDGWDRLARYCGLPWSGGGDETWAFRYYDAVPSPEPDTVRPVDVLATAALHPGLSRNDLAFFHDEADRIGEWLRALPRDRNLHECDVDAITHLSQLAEWDVPVTLSLLTKVLHRKRPLLLPLVDRHILDWYRPITGERSAAAAWPGLLKAMRDDLNSADNSGLRLMSAAVERATSHRISVLRAMDVVVWMGSQR